MAVIPINVIGHPARPGPVRPAPRSSGQKPGKPGKHRTEIKEHAESGPDEHSEQSTDAERSAHTDPVAELRAAYDRLFADFKNYKRHAEHNLAEAKASGRDELVRALVPVLADLEAASLANGGDAEAVRRGVRMIRLKLDDVLAQAGYDRVDTTQARMDPRIHEAVAVTPVRGVDDGLIMEELSPGYTRDGELVQPARVTVAKGRASRPGAPEDLSPGHENRRDGRMAGAVFEADES